MVKKMEAMRMETTAATATTVMVATTATAATTAMAELKRCKSLKKKLFSSSLTVKQNKLECLSLTRIFQA